MGLSQARAHKGHYASAPGCKDHHLAILMTSPTQHSCAWDTVSLSSESSLWAHSPLSSLISVTMSIRLWSPKI